MGAVLFMYMGWCMLHGGCWRLYGSFKGAMEDVKGQDEAVKG